MKTILIAVLVLGVLGAIFGALLAYASKIFHVDVDPKQAAVRECLAGANCGGCGYPGCDGYAAAVARAKLPPTVALRAALRLPQRSPRSWVSPAAMWKRWSLSLPCSGTEGHAEKRFNYSGPIDCQAAMLFGGKSNKTCTFACIGLGNCTRACQFDAIHIVDGVAKVNRMRAA